MQSLIARADRVHAFELELPWLADLVQPNWWRFPLPAKIAVSGEKCTTCSSSGHCLPLIRPATPWNSTRCVSIAPRIYMRRKYSKWACNGRACVPNNVVTISNECFVAPTPASFRRRITRQTLHASHLHLHSLAAGCRTHKWHSNSTPDRNHCVCRTRKCDFKSQVHGCIATA